MFKFLKPKDDLFHNLIEQQAALTLEGLELLLQYMKSHSAETAADLRMKEKEADEVRRILIDELNRTFVTPVDREITSLRRTSPAPSM